MTDVFRLFRPVPTSQHVRSYTAWPNRARGSFSQRFGSLCKKVRISLTEPTVTEPICLYSKSSRLFFFQQVIQDFYQQFVGGAHGGLTGNADVLRVLNVVKTCGNACLDFVVAVL